MNAHMSGLVRSNLVVAAGTTVSRITGLARLIVFGIVVGQTALADAFDLANNVPNAIYELLLGGVLAASLVPLFVDLLDEDADRDGIGAVWSTAIVALLAITGLAWLASPQIFHVLSISPSASVEAAAYREAGTALTRIFVVQIFFYGITALSSGLLNAQRRFFAASWSPALANLVAIASFVLLARNVDGAQPSIADVLDSPSIRYTLGLGTTLGIALMAIVQYLVVAKSVSFVSPRRALAHPAVRKLATLSTWSVGYVVANQIALIVVKNLADPGSGWVDAYAKAYVLLQLPHGLLAVSIATTFVPDLAAAAKRGAHDFADIASKGIRLTALVTFPASVGIFVLARPIVGMVFEHGNFDLTAAETTTSVVRAMALGLGGFSVYLFVLRCFYAQSDTRTPFFINLVENGLNIILAVILVDRHGVAGLGYAFAGAYLLAAVLALVTLTTKHDVALRTTVTDVAIIAIGSTLMGLAVQISSSLVGSNVGLGATSRVLVGIIAGVVTYGAYAAIFTRDVKGYLSSRTTRSSR